MELVRILLEAGADVNAGLGRRATALWWARQSGYSEVAEILRQTGAVEPPVVRPIDRLRGRIAGAALGWTDRLRRWVESRQGRE